MKREHEPRPELRSAVPRDMLPAAELLQQTQDLAAIWPPEVANNPEFRRQLEERALLRERLDGVQSRLPRPDVSLEDAIGRGIVTEEQVADLYSSLSELLKDGSEYRRLALYLPFEFLPNASATFATDRLNVEAANFQREYMSAWSSLLNVHDVRANFVDGDVLEVDKRTGDLPRVVKAAHLLPKLIEKKWLLMRDVVFMLEENTDDTLIRSIADIIPVLVDMKLASGSDIARLVSIGDERVNAKIAEAQSVRRERKQPIGVSFAKLEEQLDVRLRDIEDEQAGYDGMTSKRIWWLKSEKKRKAIQTVAEIVKAKLLAAPLEEGVAEHMLAPETRDTMKQAFTDGVRMTIEDTASQDEGRARLMYDGFRPVLNEMWQQKTPATTNSLRRLFLHLHELKIVTADELKKFDIAATAIAGPFSKNAELMQNDIRDMQQLASRLEKDDVLSKFVHPVLLTFSSWFKGYGEEGSDIDVAVFVKPGTSEENGQDIRQHLGTVLTHKKIDGEAFELWLAQDGNRLKIVEPEVYDAHRSGSYWTHILFSGLWMGNERTIRELRGQLLTRFFEEKSEGEERRFYMEEIERDAVQYRLMHKGYERRCPPFGGIKTPHADSIDGASAFWDSGYRQSATKLFVSSVFLPTI